MVYCTQKQNSAIKCNFDALNYSYLQNWSRFKKKHINLQPQFWQVADMLSQSQATWAYSDIQCNLTLCVGVCEQGNTDSTVSMKAAAVDVLMEHTKHQHMKCPHN